MVLLFVVPAEALAAIMAYLARDTFGGTAMAGVAGYAALAFLLEDARHEQVLPLLRHGAAKQALDADLADHLQRLENEPGVRSRL